MLDLRRLRLLSELAQRGTIAEVAKVVGYSPSAISQSLAQLEREAGVALLERDGRRVRLTPAARTLVARTDRVLAELDAAEAELAAEHGVVGGDVVIGVPERRHRAGRSRRSRAEPAASRTAVHDPRARARGRNPPAAVRRPRCPRLGGI